MAAELESIICEYLDELPADHPDRRYLESLRSGLSAYVDYDDPSPPTGRSSVRPFVGTALTALHINLAEQAIEFEDRHGTVGRLHFGSETVLYEGEPLLLTSAAVGPEAKPCTRNRVATPSRGKDGSRPA